MTALTSTVKLQNAYLNDMINKTVIQLRQHLHDPYTDTCPTCDLPGPCPTNTMLTKRAEDLEQLQEQLLHDENDEGDGDNGTGDDLIPVT